MSQEKTMTNFTCAFPWKFFPRLFSAIMLVALATGCDTSSGPDIQTLASKSSKKCYTVDAESTYETGCTENRPKIDASLCYKPCKSGYKGVGPVCWKKCKKKERDDGISCAKKCSGLGCLNPGKWKSKLKKNYGRGVGKRLKSICNKKYRSTGNTRCGENGLSHCTVRKEQCVWSKSGYPLCKPINKGKKWKCCKTEFGDTEDPVEIGDTEDLVETEDAEDLVEN